MRSRSLLAGLVLISGACGAFGEATDEPASVPAGPDGGLPPSPDARDASSDSTEPSVDAGCSSGCILFEDDFERPANDLVGPWTRKVGDDALGIGNAGSQQGGMVLTAKGGAGSGSGFREAFLEKTFEPRRDLAVRLQLLRVADADADAGTFGENLGSDYCQLATVLLGTHRVAMVYADRDGLGWWLYQPNEMSGEGDRFTATGAAWTSLEIAMTWTSSEIRVKTAFGSQPIAERTVSVGTFATSAPGVQVGYRCRGETPSVDVAFDAVVVRTNP